MLRIGDIEQGALILKRLVKIHRDERLVFNDQDVALHLVFPGPPFEETTTLQGIPVGAKALPARRRRPWVTAAFGERIASREEGRARLGSSEHGGWRRACARPAAPPILLRGGACCAREFV
jgi:hypothetical protein